jgi:hypothetical protein
MYNPGANDGTIERADLDGGNLKKIVPEGGTFTPKQLQLDKKNGKLYWSDREGMRVMRSNLDGSNIETLVQTGHGETDRRDARNWCVGIAVDVEGGSFTGPRKAMITPVRAASFGRIWKCRRARVPQIAKTLNSCLMACPNPSNSISILPTGRSTGRIAATHRAATP